MEIFIGIVVLVLIFLFAKGKSSKKDTGTFFNKTPLVAKNLMEG
jgi:hypothetical protein